MKAELLLKTEPAIRQTRETWFSKIRHLFDRHRMEDMAPFDPETFVEAIFA